MTEYIQHLCGQCTSVYQSHPSEDQSCPFCGSGLKEHQEIIDTANTWTHISDISPRP